MVTEKKGAYRRIASDAIKEMAKLKKLGKSLQDISDTLGVSVSSVGKYLR